MQMENAKSEMSAKNLRLPQEETLQPERIDEAPDRHLIRYLLSLPPNERTHFLRVPLPNGGSAI